MNVIIAGAGEVGGHSAEVLSAAGHNVTVIDVSAERLRKLSEGLDVRTLAGNCAHLDVLREAAGSHCDLLIAATQVDEINLLSAVLARVVGVRKSIVRVHHTAHFALRDTPYAAELGINQLICPEYMTALAIARKLRNPGAIAFEEFGRGQVDIQRLEVDANAPAVGKKLRDLELPRSVRVATIEREGGAFIADADSTLAHGDAVVLFGESKRFEIARKLFHRGKAKHLHVVILGESATAVWLCRALKSRIFSVRLFVQGHARGEESAQKLEHVTVLEADPTDSETFADERIESVDAFIAATDEDERNILACAHARDMGVKTTVVVVQRSTYLHLVASVGIDHAFSPRSVAVRAMLNMIDDDPVRSLATFADEIAEIYEVRPSAKGRVVGHELRNISLPAQSMIAAIQRGEDVRVPGADDRIEVGDTALVIGPTGIAGDLRELFASK